MSKSNKFYFVAVDKQSNMQSNIWELIVQKNDEIYLLSRVNGQDYKISIHKSGEVHAALTSEFAKNHNIKNQERYFLRKNMILQNQTLIDATTGNSFQTNDKYEIAHSIIFSSTELSNVYNEENLNKLPSDVYVLEFPNNNSVIELWFCIASTLETEIKEFSNIDKIFSFKLPSSDRDFVVLGKTYDLTPDFQKTLNEAREKALSLIESENRQYVKQITVGLSSPNEPDATIELLLNSIHEENSI